MPANEQTLAKPLSGHEIIEAILHGLRAQMQRDCFLAKHLGYASFSYTAEIRIQFQNTGTAIKEAHVWGNGQGGEVRTDLDMESVDVHASDEPKPPNIVRVETGQGVPAIVTKPQGGIEEKRIKYDPKNLPKQSTKQGLEKR